MHSLLYVVERKKPAEADKDRFIHFKYDTLCKKKKAAQFQEKKPLNVEPTHSNGVHRPCGDSLWLLSIKTKNPHTKWTTMPGLKYSQRDFFYLISLNHCFWKFRLVM